MCNTLTDWHMFSNVSCTTLLCLWLRHPNSGIFTGLSKGRLWLPCGVESFNASIFLHAGHRLQSQRSLTRQTTLNLRWEMACMMRKRLCMHPLWRRFVWAQSCPARATWTSWRRRQVAGGNNGWWVNAFSSRHQCRFPCVTCVIFLVSLVSFSLYYLCHFPCIIVWFSLYHFYNIPLSHVSFSLGQWLFVGL